MSLGQFALQSAIFTRLNSDNTLTSTNGATVVDEPLLGDTYPLVVIGEETTITLTLKNCM